jgi:hypothetical protein
MNFKALHLQSDKFLLREPMTFFRFLPSVEMTIEFGMEEGGRSRTNRNLPPSSSKKNIHRHPDSSGSLFLVMEIIDFQDINTLNFCSRANLLHFELGHSKMFTSRNQNLEKLAIQ